MMGAILGTQRRLLGALVGAALLHAGSASAISLMQAYEAALQNDPTYRSAGYDNAAGQENAKIARAALLPNLSANYSASKNRADIVGVDFIGQPNITHPIYFSRVKSIDLNQPILNLDAWSRYKQGQAQGRYSSAVYDSSRQDLVLRLVSAYIDALFAEEQLRLAHIQRDVYAEQRKVNDRLFEKGEGTKTDMLETQSKLDVAEAQILESADNAVTTRDTLAGIIGQEVQSLDDVVPDFRPHPLDGGGYEDWKRLALANNPDLRAQVEAIEASHQEVNRNRAGYAPRIDFVASYSKNDSQTIDTYNQDSTVRSVGFQVNIPLYSGGSVGASTRQAVANLEKSRSDLQAKTDKALIELRKEYNIVLSSSPKIAALDKAVASSQELVKATEKSIKGGIRINLDLLNAQQQLFTNLRDRAQARYDYLVALVRLRAAAGTLSGDDVREIGTYFR